MKWYKNKAFIEELDRRTAEYKSGKVKGRSWEEAKKIILASFKKNNLSDTLNPK